MARMMKSSMKVPAVSPMIWLGRLTPISVISSTSVRWGPAAPPPPSPPARSATEVPCDAAEAAVCTLLWLKSM